jgi:hypothetical protein
MVSEQIRKITVLTPVDHLEVGILPCGEYSVSKQMLVEKGMRFMGYLLHSNGAFKGECLILAEQVDTLVTDGKIRIEWGL